jgi:putative addiction module component (TIGR02574 family)
MSASLKQIEEQARALAPEDRAKLAESMLESLHSPVVEIQQAWNEEIERRGATFDCGGTRAYPAEDVFAEARRIR